MLLLEAYARERTLGEYKRVVWQIRHNMNEQSAHTMAKMFGIRIEDCVDTISMIQEHPDWDDEKIAEEIDWAE